MIPPDDAAQPARRSFLKRAGAVTATTLASLAAHCAWANAGGDRPPARRRSRSGRYGDLRPARDTDGRTVLALPAGFQYSTFSRTGETFAPGLVVARNHDGMACFEGPRDTVRLIRNHELRNAPGDFTLGVDGPVRLRYDAKGMGGCMTLDFDTRAKRVVRQFVSLGGTIVNCSGGWSYGNRGWLTCEESTLGIKDGYEKPHGFCFQVPAGADSTVIAEPLTAMGRFTREAAVADARGVVYQTEDAGRTSGFYRFVPDRAEDLRSGRLQMLAIKGGAGADLFGRRTAGTRLPVEWVDIPNPNPDLEAGAQTCFAQGRSRGGAAFARLEGIFRGEDGLSIYFVSTSGGGSRGSEGGDGQLWHYVPAGSLNRKENELVMVFESPSGSVLESPDNLCITPNGAVLFCEDDALGDADTHPLAPGIKEVNRLVALGDDGEPFTFAVNVLNASEFAGACFSPDGEILFVNLFGDATPGSGMTCAIWGPWERGPL